MDKMLKMFAMIKCDKYMHISIGVFIYVASSLIFQPIVALSIVALVAVIKEIYDSYSLNHTSTFSDIIATVSLALLLFLKDCTNASNFLR